MIQKNDVPDSGGSIFDRLRVADLMEKEVQFGHEQTKGDVLASLMIEGFGGVPIVDGNQRLVGIVTEFDLLAVLDTGKKLSDISAGSDYDPRNDQCDARHGYTDTYLCAAD